MCFFSDPVHMIPVQNCTGIKISRYEHVHMITVSHYGFKLLWLALLFHVFSYQYRVNTKPKHNNLVTVSFRTGIMWTGSQTKFSTFCTCIWPGWGVFISNDTPSGCLGGSRPTLNHLALNFFSFVFCSLFVFPFFLTGSFVLRSSIYLTLCIKGLAATKMIFICIH